MMKRYLAVFLLISSGILLALFSPQGRADQDPAALIVQANQLFDRWSGEFDFAAYEGRLRQAIGLWEEALPLIPAAQVQTEAHVLNQLAQGYFELADGYLTTNKEMDKAYGKGKDFALESLRLDPDFVRIEQQKGHRAALSSAEAVAAIFWYGNDLGSWLNYHQLTALTGGVRDVLASFSRAVELDERYLGGGPQRALAAFLAQVPGFLGGNLEGSREHFERSIELDGDYLENYINYAEYYAKPKRDWDLFCSLLRTALDKAEEPVVMAKWPFYNKLSLDRAQSLWGWRDRGRRVCGQSQ